MQKRTKILSTLGPATDDPKVLENLIEAGVNAVRLNFSHGEPDDHKKRAQMVREIAAKHDLHIAILGDLQGPKIRISRFAEGPINLEIGDEFTLNADLDRDAGDQTQVGLDYPELISDLSPGDNLLLDDGRVVLQVKEVIGNSAICTTTVAGKLSNNKGINREGGGLSAPALTDKDRKDIHLAAEIAVDYLAVSFPRDAADMELARKLMQEAGGAAGMVAKIERAETVQDYDCLDAIIKASDAVMVARGDLGVEIGDAELIGVQKYIINRSRELNRVVITATQMMESMISSPIPTRAEVFDVANAVLDGTDVVMLSAETAAGGFPVETVQAMARIIKGAEKHPQARRSSNRINDPFETMDESIALSAMYTANHLAGVKAVVCMTESGRTPLIMSRVASSLPIFAFCRKEKTQTKVALYRGVEAISFDVDSIPPKEMNQAAVNALLARGILEPDDLLIITKGDYVNAQGGTNTMKIFRAGDVIH